jgi:hypothetical protein
MLAVSQCTLNGLEKPERLDVFSRDFDADFLLVLFAAAEDAVSAFAVVDEAGYIDGELMALITEPPTAAVDHVRVAALGAVDGVLFEVEERPMLIVGHRTRVAGDDFFGKANALCW